MKEINKKIVGQFKGLLSDKITMGFALYCYETGIVDAMMTLENPPDAKLYPTERINVMFEKAVVRMIDEFETELNRSEQQ